MLSLVGTMLSLVGTMLSLVGTMLSLVGTMLSRSLAAHSERVDDDVADDDDDVAHRVEASTGESLMMRWMGVLVSTLSPRPISLLLGSHRQIDVLSR
jgi:hypothetical protein